MNYFRLLVIASILMLQYGAFVIPDDNTYLGEDLPVIELCGERILPDSLKADQLLLAKLINAEAGGESLNGMRGVGDVVIYRMEHHNMSLTDVIYDDGEFDGIYSPHFKSKPSVWCMYAAKMALLRQHILPTGILFYHNPVTSTDKGWLSYIERYTYDDIDNHRFCFHPNYFREI